VADQSRKMTVIVGDGSPIERNHLFTVLRLEGYEVRLAENGEEVLNQLQTDSSIALALLDLAMPVKSGLDTLLALRQRQNGVAVVLMSEGPVPSSIVRMIEEHDARFIEKTQLPDRLGSLNTSGEHPVSSKNGADQPFLVQRQNLRAEGPVMGAITPMVAQVGRANVPVLLQGETGVGKEVLARQIHANSPRAAKQFVKINCAALPSELVESELFGHERGAFSGAVAQRQGLFETAHEGTMLLDEIGDMDVRRQAKLLQVLQDGEFRRLGGRELVRVNVRVLAATHQDLRKSIQECRFREDLYYRLNVFCIRIPPMRERRAEILPLAEHFLQKYATADFTPPPITQDLRDAMLGYHWPGNIRELENAMRRYLILRNPVSLAEELRSLECSLLTPKAGPYMAASVPDNRFDQAGALARAERAKLTAEREAVLGALRSTHWNRTKAAELLRIDYKALLYKMKKLSIGTDGKSGAGKPVVVSEAKFSSMSETGLA
jgi:two-component system, NtrC family, response regulator AtoC